MLRPSQLFEGKLKFGVASKLCLVFFLSLGIGTNSQAQASSSSQNLRTTGTAQNTRKASQNPAIAPVQKPSAIPTPQFSSELIERGRKVYRAQCVQCHNANPQKDGSQGPANYGSSLELLRAKVLEGRYPDGYIPKRKTRNMTRMPHLKKEIEALHAFLNTPPQN